MRAIARGCLAVLSIGMASPALAEKATGIFEASAVLHLSAAGVSSGRLPEVPMGAHVTVSRAGDALGAAVDFRRPAAARLRTGGRASVPSGLPVAAMAMTSRFGMRLHPLLGAWRRHSGVDLAAPMGTPVVATSDGLVGAAGWYGGYGLFVSLEHGGGLQTRYGHMSRLAVAAGQQVRRGEVIGYVGSTGRSTGPHLHYEMRLDGQAIDPVRAGSTR